MREKGEETHRLAAGRSAMLIKTGRTWCVSITGAHYLDYPVDVVQDVDLATAQDALADVLRDDVMEYL